MEKLQTLDLEARIQAALHLVIDKIEKMPVGDLMKEPGMARREIMTRAEELSIDPNEILGQLQELLEPQIEALFRPFTKKEAADNAREERRRKSTAQRARPDRNGKR